jgi:hypothetical protein
MKDQKLKMRNLLPHIHWVPRGLVPYDDTIQ